MLNIRRFIGLAGVAKNETHQAHRWGRFFEFVMVFIAIWLPLQWHLQNHHQISSFIVSISNWLVWIFFVAETTVLFLLVRRKLNYLKRNWMNFFIVILTFPFVWQETLIFTFLRSLQLLLMLRLMLPWWDTSVHFLSRNRLGSTLFAAFVTTTLAGVLMAVIDNQYKTPWDGIWWAWQTVATVGYGDMVPGTLEGRLLAIFMMLMGLAFLSLLTANFSAYFISQGTEQVEKTEDEMLKILKDIQDRMNKIEKDIKIIKIIQKST